MSCRVVFERDAARRVGLVSPTHDPKAGRGGAPSELFLAKRCGHPPGYPAADQPFGVAGSPSLMFLR